MAVIGPSGSGKSSVVRAGLFPPLLEQGNWLIDSFRPGYPNNNPFRNLASVLVPLLETRMSENERLEAIKKQSEKLSKGEIDLSDAIARILQKNSHKRLLLFVDQFEELYTLCRDTQEQQRFVDALLATVQSAPRAVTLVLTLRADFYSYVLNYPAFGEALERHNPLSLRAMNREEMLSCIERPAEKMGVQLEEGLTQRILDEVKQEPGNLPLLEFALTQLWAKQSRGLLTHQAYSEIGGVAKALALHAEAVYANLSEEKQKQAQRLFVQLVRPGEGTEDTRRLATPVEVGNWELVTFLAGEDARLVVTGRDEQTEEETVEVVHEALIREWGRLRGWMESDRTFRTWQEQLRVAMRQWQISDKQEGYLLQSAPLGEAEGWLEKRREELSSTEQEFIGLSKDEKQRRELKELEAQVALDTATERNQILAEANQERDRKIRRGNITLGVTSVLAFLVITLTSIYALQKFREAQEAQEGTKLEQAGVNALFQFKSGELSSLVSAMQSTQYLQNLIRNGRDFKDYPAVSPVLALQKILDEIHEQNYFDAGQGEIRSAVFMPGGDRFVTAGKGKEGKEDTLQIWNLTGRKEASLLGHEGGVLGGVNAVSVSSDKKNPLIASAGEDGTVRLWERSGKQIRQLMPQGSKDKSSFSAISVSKDGQKIVAGQHNGVVYLWERSGKQLKTWVAHGSDVTAISFSQDGQKLATAGKDGLARVWSISGNKLAELKNAEIHETLGVSFSPDGQFVATASDDHRARIWTVNGQEVVRLEGHQYAVTVVNFSPDGRTVATGSDDGSVKLWDMKGQKLKEFLGHRGVVWSASFSPDGKRLVSAGRDGFVRLWNLAEKPVQQLKLAGFRDDVNAIAFSPDGKAIAGAGNEGVMRLWDASGKELKVWKEAIYQNRNVQDIAFSPNGKFIVAGGLFSIARVWNLSGSLTEPQVKLKGKEGSPDGHRGDISGVAVSPDSQLIATGSSDKTMRIWKPKGLNGELVKATLEQEGEVSRVMFTADGHRIVTADWEGNVAIWDLAGKQISKWKKVHQTQIWGLGITRDGSRIVTADKSSYVKILDRSGKQLREFFSYQSGINKLVISPDGQLIATGGMDGTVRLWDFQGHQIAEFRNPKGAIWGVAFSPDSRRIALAGDKGFVNVRSTPSLLSLMQQGCKWLGDYLESHPDEKAILNVCK